VDLGLEILAIILISFWSRRSGWDGRHRLALAGGAALTYAWHAFFQNPAVGKAGVIMRTGNAVFAAALVIFLAIAARRNHPQLPPLPFPPQQSQNFL
jgi:hypothetical protein